MIAKGTYVKWKEQDQEISGMIQESYPEDVKLTLDDREMSRHGSPKDQALFILDDDGNKYLKLESEVEKK